MRDYFDWSKEAACSKMDTGDFFPTKEEKSTKDVREVCNTVCPVNRDCLIHAIIYREYGIWGGKTEKERKYMGEIMRDVLIYNAKQAGVYYENIARQGK